jgi:hypothetical protein
MSNLLAEAINCDDGGRAANANLLRVVFPKDTARVNLGNLNRNWVIVPNDLST